MPTIREMEEREVVVNLLKQIVALLETQQNTMNLIIGLLKKAIE